MPPTSPSCSAPGAYARKELRVKPDRRSVDSEQVGPDLRLASQTTNDELMGKWSNGWYPPHQSVHGPRRHLKKGRRNALASVDGWQVHTPGPWVTGIPGRTNATKVGAFMGTGMVSWCGRRREVGNHSESQHSALTTSAMTRPPGPLGPQEQEARHYEQKNFLFHVTHFGSGDRFWNGLDLRG